MPDHVRRVSDRFDRHHRRASPLNGFVSEWLVYQGFFSREPGAQSALRLALLGAPALALVGGLALACFAKAAGVVFFGHPRSDRPLAAREVKSRLRGSQLVLGLRVLALACCLRSSCRIPSRLRRQLPINHWVKWG